MARTISKKGLQIILDHEGFVPTWYRCPAGVWTIGYGTTEATLKRLTGQDRRSTRRLTEAEAGALVEQTLADEVYPVIEDAVRRRIKRGQFDALCSFIYNLGETNFRRSTLLRRINDGDTEGAAAQFKRWNRAGKRVLPGLTRRRAEEAALFLS